MHMNEGLHVIIDRNDGAVHLLLQRSISEHFKTGLNSEA